MPVKIGWRGLGFSLAFVIGGAIWLRETDPPAVREARLKRRLQAKSEVERAAATIAQRENSSAEPKDQA